jgi:hypothetical protein
MKKANIAMLCVLLSATARATAPPRLVPQPPPLGGLCTAAVGLVNTNGIKLMVTLKYTFHGGPHDGKWTTGNWPAPAHMTVYLACTAGSPTYMPNMATTVTYEIVTWNPR